MEEPKVLYLQTDSSHPAGKRYLNLNKVSDNDIEYIRKDAFIDKVAKWLEDNAIEYWGTEAVDNGMMIDDFKKAMKL